MRAAAARTACSTAPWGVAGWWVGKIREGGGVGFCFGIELVGQVFDKDIVCPRRECMLVDGGVPEAIPVDSLADDVMDEVGLPMASGTRVVVCCKASAPVVHVRVVVGSGRKPSQTEDDTLGGRQAGRHSVELDDSDSQ